MGKREPSNGHKKVKPDEGSDRYSSLFRWVDIVQIDGLWNRLFILLRKVKGKIHIRNVDSEISVSLGDDYYTGMFSGILLPLTLILNNSAGNSINVQPVFEEDLIFKGYLTAGMRLRPISVIIPCLQFVASEPVRKQGTYWRNEHEKSCMIVKARCRQITCQSP